MLEPSEMAFLLCLLQELQQYGCPLKRLGYGQVGRAVVNATLRTSRKTITGTGRQTVSLHRRIEKQAREAEHVMKMAYLMTS